MVQSLRQSVAAWADPPRVIFISRADEQESIDFFARHWPQAHFISDPSGKHFRAYGVARAGCWQLLGWRAWLSALRAFLKGHRLAGATRDIWQMPAYVLVENGQIRWSFYPREPGQQPVWNPPPWLGR